MWVDTETRYKIKSKSKIITRGSQYEAGLLRWHGRVYWVSIWIWKKKNNRSFSWILTSVLIPRTEWNLLICLLIWKGKWHKEWERDVFHALINSPNGQKRPGQRQEPNTPSSSCIWVAGTKILGPSLALPSFQDMTAEHWLQSSGTRRPDSSPVQAASIIGSRGTCCTTGLAP